MKFGVGGKDKFTARGVVLILAVMILEFLTSKSLDDLNILKRRFWGLATFAYGKITFELLLNSLKNFRKYLV